MVKLFTRTLRYRFRYLPNTVKNRILAFYRDNDPLTDFYQDITLFERELGPIIMQMVNVVNNYRAGGRFGFISSHAANAFGFAMFMTLLLRNKLLGITLFIWATINAYTRIYLGVHFISDIVPGMLSGLLFGFVAYHIYMWARYHFLSASVCPFLSDPSYMYQGKRVQAITIAVWLMFVFLLCFSGVLISFIR